MQPHYIFPHESKLGLVIGSSSHYLSASIDVLPCRRIEIWWIITPNHIQSGRPEVTSCANSPGGFHKTPELT